MMKISFQDRKNGYVDLVLSAELYKRWKALVGTVERVSIWLKEGVIYVSPRQLLTSRFHFIGYSRSVILRKDAVESIIGYDIDDWKWARITKNGLYILYDEDGCGEDEEPSRDDMISYKSLITNLVAKGRYLRWMGLRKQNIEELVNEYYKRYEWKNGKIVFGRYKKREFMVGKGRITFGNRTGIENGNFRPRFYWNDVLEVVKGEGGAGGNGAYV